jgi:sirohydrochlorin cobaltochelatase
MNDSAIMICGHGSRDLDAVREFDTLVSELRKQLPGRAVGSGFLEFARPMIREGLDSLKAQGATHIKAVPAMLFAAGHVKNDLPWELNTWAAENPGNKVEFGRDLAIDLKLIEAAKQRIEEAEAKAARPATRAETLLVVVGRGTNDPDANSNVAKVARMLWEGMGLGWATVAYSGVAHPRTNECLARAVRLGFRRIVVFPYFLFNGLLIKRIYEQTAEVARLNGDVEFLTSQRRRRLPRTARRNRQRPERDELHGLQIPDADHRLRGRCGCPAGRAPSACARHRHRRGSRA